METEIGGHSYTIYIKGLWGRNRKEKRETDTLLSFTEVVLTEPEIRAMVDKYLAALKPKSLTWQVEINKAYQKRYDDGTVMNGFLLCSNQAVLSGKV